MAIKITGEAIVPASGEGFCVDVYEQYTHAHGLRRARHIMKVAESDFWNGHKIQYSEDNGRTWGPEEDAYGEDFTVAPDGSWELLNHDYFLDVYNPAHRHFVGIRLERIFLGGRDKGYATYWEGRPGYKDHCYVVVRREVGGQPDIRLIRYEDGPELDPVNPLNEAYLSKNFADFSKLCVAKNGDILFPIGVPASVCCRMLGLDVREVFPSSPDIFHGVIVCRGVWNGAFYDLTFSRPVVISDLASSRGLLEPTIAELENGRIVVICRGSNVQSKEWRTRIEPGTPGFKWWFWSDDGGKIFTQPAPWHFDDGEVIYSSATPSYFIRSGRNGKLYWIGNITSYRIVGNYPPWPLQIVEVDEKHGTAKKTSLAVIDTKRDWEHDEVQLSNFYLLDDRESGNLELWLMKYGQYSYADAYRADTWKYTIHLEE